ncbi:MAG: hypothetical protein AAFQ39_12800 [Pseudomonadota bacterium]
MKRMLFTTAAAAALAATSAFADSQLREQLANELNTSNMMIDVAQLTDEQVAELYAATTSTDDHSERRNKVAAVLAGSDYVMMTMGTRTVFVPISSLKNQVEMGVSSYGFEVDAETLEEEELAELYIAISSEDRENARSAIESVLQ